MTETRPRLTEEEFMALPDDGRKYELVNGAAQVVPTGALHGETAALLLMRLAPDAWKIGRIYGSSVG